MGSKDDTETHTDDLHYMTLRALVEGMKPEVRNLLARAIVTENATKAAETSGQPYLWNLVLLAIDAAERDDDRIEVTEAADI